MIICFVMILILIIRVELLEYYKQRNKEGSFRPLLLESDIVPFLSLSLLFLFLSLSLYLSPSLCLFLSSYIFFSNYYLNKFRLIFTLRQGSKLYFSSLVNPRKAQFINLKPPFVEITFLVIKISQRPEVFAQI